MFISVDDRGEVRAHSHLTDDQILKLVSDGLTVMQVVNTVARRIYVMVYDEDAMAAVVKEDA
jgi:hypothetical protein